ncbi:MAG: leucine-rich repeat domain-containing protein [Clostridia bacterium]|nr:leucine-rich repeat domain-containing protein [Clostridia bacterium]
MKLSFRLIWILCLLLCLSSAAYAAEGVLTLPRSLSSVADEAFMGDDSLTSVVIPAGATRIGARAFASCGNLTEVTIPYTVNEIADDAFLGCHKVVVTALEGSYAWDWCEANQVAVQPLIIDTTGYTFSEATSYIDGQWVVIGSVIDRYSGNSTELRLPTHDENGLPVVRISYRAFSGNTRITSVVIPDTVTNISYAFEDCTALEHVVLSQNLTDIGSAFKNCTALEEIILPESVQYLGSAFEGCTALQNVTLPDSLTVIQYNAFKGCTSLRNLTLPSGIKKIWARAFEGCTSLTEIHFPSSLESLGESAFKNCVNLERFNYPVGLKQGRDYLGVVEYYLSDQWYTWVDQTEGPFEGCPKITSIAIPEGISHVAPFLFADSAIRSISFPSTLRSIGSCAFANCQNLREIRIPDHVTDLETFAFANCKNVTNVKLPVGWNAVGFSAASIDHNHGIDYLERIDASPFYGCSGLTAITMPEGCTRVPEQAFYGMNNLVSVHLPDTVEYIDSKAFYGSGVEELFLPESVTSVNPWAFYGDSTQYIKTIWMGPNLSVGTLQLGGYKKKLTIHGLADTSAEAFAGNNSHTFIADYRGTDHIYVPWHTTARHAHVIRYVCTHCDDSYWRNSSFLPDCWRCLLMRAYPNGSDLPIESFDFVERYRIGDRIYYRAELLKEHAGIQPTNEKTSSMFYLDENLRVVTDEAVLEKLLTMWLFVGDDTAWDHAQGESQTLQKRRESVSSLLKTAAEHAELANDIHSHDLSMEAVGEIATSGLQLLWGNPGAALKNFIQAVTVDAVDSKLLLTLTQMKIISELQETCITTAQTYNALIDELVQSYADEELYDYDLCMQALDYYAAASGYWRITTDISSKIIQEIVDCQSAFGVGLRNISKMLDAVTEDDPIYYMVHNVSTKLTKAISGGEVEAQDFLDIFVDTAKILTEDIAGKNTGIGAFVTAYRMGTFSLNTVFDVKDMFETYEKSYNAFLVDLADSEFLNMHLLLAK